MIRIKICGVTTPEDAAAISAMGADAIGLNFIPSSPRMVTVDQAVSIIRSFQPFTVPVGLFDSRDKLASFGDLLEQTAIGLYQIYNWNDDFFFEPQRYILPFQIRTAADVESALQRVNHLRSAGADIPAAVILDSHSDHALGGTGHVAPWHLLAGFDPGVPVILAGGLTPDNVAEAIRIVKPWGVDVASGVEKSPRVKDLKKVKDFIAAARGAASAL